MSTDSCPPVRIILILGLFLNVRYGANAASLMRDAGDGGQSFANFEMNSFHYLNITPLIQVMVDAFEGCGLSCLRHASCFSFNVVATPCQNEPCKNGKTCLAKYEDDSYECACVTAYAGKSFETGHQTDIAEGRYFIENVETERYLFQTGNNITGNRGNEGGWTKSPPVVGSDDNYNNLAYWNIIPQGDGKYFIENQETQRYLFQTGGQVKGNPGDEGGWTGAPSVVGSDANYYNRAYWYIIPQGDGTYFIQNLENKRYLFQTGDEVKGNRGDEGGWTGAPSVVGSDANYCNLAYWKLLKQ
ncbi:uncharacterized protein [Montipora foliosa]|uniref:uncharacterized protein n=1 Tax=Montipora foliosa TaxID=591990 RepID=UPI0035F1F5EE